MRIDHKNLRQWLQNKLEYFGITEWKVVDSYSSRFTSQQYESGAYKMSFKLVSSAGMEVFIKSYYSCSELRDELRRGMSLFLNFKNSRSLADAEIDVRRD